ncbi:carboxylesterase family protein [Streptomyces longispororuber]|uniref:carboxylesterase/lipase family protein n=1 Tax=Streptomyces longispororuber TaxID=68230 RepID=UPI0033C00DA2
MSLPLRPPLRARRAARAGQSALALTLALVATWLTPASSEATTDRPADRSPLVHTANGWVRGQATADGHQFLGIPYAQPPTGERRWKAPLPARAWRGVRDATQYGDYCAQNTYWAPGFEKRHTTEDCLTVNVYTPPGGRRHGDRGRLPVMVWVHGGGNVGGAGRDIVPDEFARRTDTVVVTLNYRLGALGFLTLPDTSGNFALLDQQLAMRWVQHNIRRFGGDPRQVTLAGESAGGRAVCTQLASPSSRGLYRAAIVQSGAYGDCAGTPRKQAVEAGLAFAAKAGCTDPGTAAACLRSKPTGQILDAQQDTGSWGYTVGGAGLPRQPAAAFAAKEAVRVPVMNGANSKEGLVFAYDSFDRRGNTLTADAYPQALIDAFAQKAGTRALHRYPLSAYERPAYAYAAAFGDRLFACPALRVNPLLAERGRVYGYEFADRTSPLFASLPQNTGFDFGATHAAELNYLFKPYGRGAKFNAEQRALSRQMTAYWGSFIHGHAPSAAGQPAMPEQSSQPGRVLRLRTSSAGGNATTADLPGEHHCDLWDPETSG